MINTRGVEKEATRDIMLRKLREKRERDKRRVEANERSVNRSFVAKLLSGLPDLTYIGLFVLLLGCGIAVAGTIGTIIIFCAVAIAILFLNKAFGGHLIRAGVIVVSLTLAILLWIGDWLVYPIRRLSGWKVFNHTYQVGERPNVARRLTIAFQNLGPAFIKLGQILSMAAVVPRHWMAEFAKLCDYLPPISYETVRTVIQDELGAPPEELFEYIDLEPIGAASLAQVHCVVLKDGREAVVKVQRPGTKALFERDYRILEPIAMVLEILFKILGRFIKLLADVSPMEIIRDYGQATSLDETDFAYEGTVMQMTHNSLERHGLQTQLHVPEIYWDYTTESLLTMERMWIYFKFVDLDISKPEEVYSWLDFIGAMGYNSSLVLKRGYRAWWHPFSCYGVLNMDVHQGNFLYSYDDVLTLVDFGINFYGGSSARTEQLRPGVIQLWRGIMSSNYKDVVDACRGNLGLLSGLSEEDAFIAVSEEFQKFLDPIIHVSEREGMTGAFIIDFTTYMTGGEFWAGLVQLLVNLAKRAGVHLQYDLLALIRMIPYWATWMEIIDPQWNLFTEGDSLNAYWFGPDDGKTPYKGTNIYPSPFLEYQPEIWLNPRSLERQRMDDASLCYSSSESE
ncbi:MAG: AarF/UbiB family protein [Chloroflexota bacterium]|nr:AarF/UbiB family protein [Chloroflexota bacterium]